MKKIIVCLLLFVFFSRMNCFSIVFVDDGYTDKFSYRAGETVTFFLNGEFFLNPSGSSLVLEDISGNPVLSISGFDNIQPQTPGSTPWADGFGYQATNTWTVPPLSDLKSGYYLLNGIDCKIPIIIKGDNTSGGADIVVVCHTNTEVAYSDYLNHSFYYGSDGNEPVLSFDKPRQQHLSGTLTGDSEVEAGFLKWIAGTSYNINVISDNDLDEIGQGLNPEIQYAKLLIIIGHNEYWTRQERLNFDQFVDYGNDAMILSGNTMGWQVRYNIDDSDPNHIKHQIICYKHDNSPADPWCDPSVFKTLDWDDPSLKYSIYGSIGTDGSVLPNYNPIRMGIYGTDPDCDYGGFNGQKIILHNSPLLISSQISPALNDGDLVQFANGEYDCTLISGLDANNNNYPILDVSALGFYKAEMIAYDQSDKIQPDMPITMQYAPIIAFKKTCTSGRIVNVSSNFWCSDIGMGNITYLPAATCTTAVVASIPPNAILMQNITQNMIDLLKNGYEIFADPNPPSAFILKPAPVTVSYQACQHGSIRITPCGVEITDGYKVDNHDGTFTAKVVDCTDCDGHSSRLATITNTNNSNKMIEEKVSLYPNPNNGEFILKIDNNQKGKFTLEITDISGRVLNEKNTLVNGVNVIEVKDLASGLYLWQAYSANKLIGNGKIVILSNQ